MKKGFTLIEMLIVVVIIGMLATIIAVGIPRHLRRARIEMTKARIARIKTAIQDFDLQVKRLPASLEELLKEGDENWPGPFLDEPEDILDVWENEFRYEPGTKRIRIRSAGPDGTFDNDDDIVK